MKESSLHRKVTAITCISMSMFILEGQSLVCVPLGDESDVAQAEEWEEERSKLELNCVNAVQHPATETLILRAVSLLPTGVIEPAEQIVSKGLRHLQ